MPTSGRSARLAGSERRVGESADDSGFGPKPVSVDTGPSVRLIGDVTLDKRGEMTMTRRQKRGLCELYAEDPEREDRLVFGRICHPDR